MDTQPTSRTKGNRFYRIAVFFLTALLSAMAGGGLTVAYLHHKQDEFRWRQLSIDSTSFTTEALFGSDIPLPTIRNISGRAKFRQNPENLGQFQLGYVMDFEIDKLDRAKLPEKYRKPTVYQSKQGEYTIDPVAEVVYVAKFVFTLRDKDGFQLMKIESSPEYIYSGKKSELQGVVPEGIRLAIAERTTSILAEISVQKCETCR